MNCVTDTRGELVATTDSDGYLRLFDLHDTMDDSRHLPRHTSDKHNDKHSFHWP